MYRSQLEEKTAKQLKKSGVTFEYEPYTISYTQPAVDRKYSPDFVLGNGVVLEVKGLLTAEDRKKHLWIKEQKPDLDIRFIFGNSRNKIYRGSKTTYANWAQKNGFQYADYKDLKTWIKWLEE